MFDTQFSLVVANSLALVNFVNFPSIKAIETNVVSKI